MKIKIITENCVTGHVCPMVNICPHNAIIHEDITKAPTINYDICTVCGRCTKIWCKTFVFESNNQTKKP